MARVRRDEQDHGRDSEPHLRGHEHASPIAPVDHGTDQHRRNDHGQELREPDEPDRGRGVGEPVNLHEERDGRDLAAGLRDELAEPQHPEVARCPQRPEVDGQSPQAAPHAGIVPTVSRLPDRPNES